MKILLVHPDNPAHESSWSGTPFFLMKALSIKAITVVPFATGSENEIIRLFFKVIHFVIRTGYQYSLSFRIFSAKRLKSAISVHNPDIVLHMGTSSAITYLNTKIPNYLYTDSTWHTYTKSYFKIFKIKPLPWEINRIDKIQKHDYNKFAGIFTLSNYTKGDLINHYQISAKKVHYVGGGTGNVNPYYGEKDYSKKQLLFVVRHSFKIKGGELMLAAVRVLQNKVPDIKIIICGGAKIRSDYKDIKNIEIKGFTSKDELQTLFEESSLLVMPSLCEPFGLVYLEAMLNKTPVVGLNRGALPDITDDGKFGFLAKEPTPEAVANQISRALSDLRTLKLVAIKGQQFVLDNFTWEKVTDRILEIIYAYFSNEIEA